MRIGGRGRLAPGVESNANADEFGVLPPQVGAPHEELVSLVFFFELDHDALVTPLAPPIGRRSDLAPVVSAPFLRERLDAISAG